MDHRSLIIRIAGAGLLASTLVMGSAMAQQEMLEEQKSQETAESGSEAEQKQSSGAADRKAIMQTQRKMQNLQRELGKVQQKALEENPELAEKQEALQDLVISTMQDNGHTPEKDMERMKEIREKMQSGDVEKAEKQKMAQEMRKHQQSLVQARQEAFQDEEVQKKTSEFREELMAAMKETDPEAESLIEEYNKTRQKMQQDMQKMQQQRSQQQGNG